MNEKLPTNESLNEAVKHNVDLLQKLKHEGRFGGNVNSIFYLLCNVDKEGRLSEISVQKSFSKEQKKEHLGIRMIVRMSFDAEDPAKSFEIYKIDRASSDIDFNPHIVGVIDKTVEIWNEWQNLDKPGDEKPIH